jgi:hypothetical protein
MVQSANISVLSISLLQHAEGPWSLTGSFPVVLVPSLGPTLLHVFSLVSLALRCLLLLSSNTNFSNNGAMLSSFYAIALITFVQSLAINAIIADVGVIVGPPCFPPTQGGGGISAKEGPLSLSGEYVLLYGGLTTATAIELEERRWPQTLSWGHQPRQ